MHTIFFGVKRLHLLVQRLEAFLLNWEIEVDITPARLEMLRIIHAYKGEIARWQLIRLLGRSGSGVSRMLKVLERDGLVHRFRAPWNRRNLLAKLTDAGTQLVEQALRYVKTKGFHELARGYFDDESDASMFERQLIHARVSLNDPAPYDHPWAARRLWDECGTIVLQRPIPAAPRTEECWMSRRADRVARTRHRSGPATDRAWEVSDISRRTPWRAECYRTVQPT